MSSPGETQVNVHHVDRLARWLAATNSTRLDRRAAIGSALGLGAIVARLRFTTGVHVLAATESALNDAVTAEGLLVTLQGVGRTRATDLTLDEQTIRLLRAAQCEDEAHFNNLVSKGAAPTTGRYTLPDSVVENATNFLTTWVELKQIMIGMYLAAARTFGEDENYDLVELAFQIGTVEAQHYALLRQFMGERIPADRAFPEWAFASTSEAVQAIADLGFIGGTGQSYDYPGPGDRYCRGITGLVAETTLDQTPPDVTPDPDSATPITTDATPVSEEPDASPTANE